MKNNVLILILVSFFICGAVYSQEKNNIEIKEEQELEEIYNRIRELKKEGIEIHYQKVIIQKGPEDERGYLKHLLSELEKALKKGKKYGKINRVEGDLVEIDKGAIHKVHDRDVYIVCDSSGRYKGKVEIGAIADAISIGRSYEVKKGRKIEPGDKIRFRGNRKFFEIGLSGAWRGNNRDMDVNFYVDKHFTGWRSIGLNWLWNLRGGQGLEFWTGYLEQRRFYSKYNIYYEDYSDRVRIFASLGYRKYFFYPWMVSPFLSCGLAYFSGKYYHKSETVSKLELIPYFTAGLQLFSGRSFHIELTSKFFYGPKIKIGKGLSMNGPIYCI